MSAGTPGRVGALTVLAGCFALSAVLRAGTVVAARPELIGDGFGHQVATAPTGATEAGAARIAETEALIRELKRERQRVRERAEALDSREALLSAIERRLESRLREVTEARARLAETAALVDDAAVKDVERLAEMYQRMKPKQAGQIFNQMDAGFASGFLAEMRPDAAALILANMDATKAYAVTLLLAGRNVEPAAGRGR